MGDLESLKAVATFSFLSDDIEDRVNKFSSLGVVTLGPVVASSGLSEDEVVWSEELTEWSGSNRVHGAWFKIHEDCSWDVTASSGFVVVDVDSLKLEVGVTVIGSSWVNSVLI